MTGLTDRAKLLELLALADRELAASFHGRPSGSLAAAEQACTQGEALLPRIPNLPRAERRRLEASLTELRGLLDRAPTRRVAARAACAGEPSHKSQLLFGGFGSTVPGLGEVGDGGAGYARRLVRKRPPFRHVPYEAEDVAAFCAAAFLALNELLNSRL